MSEYKRILQDDVIEWGRDLGRHDGDDVQTMIRRENNSLKEGEIPWRLPTVDEVRKAFQKDRGNLILKLPATGMWATLFKDGPVVTVSMSGKEVSLSWDPLSQLAQLYLVKDVMTTLSYPNF